ncbi:hypothetical protein M9H77_16406 [Catharanthus roseus]|uniref:Uncharacterized protein n=1 Tax=Catharanthus roseus TaxID=4058 RepID=A0ACC0B1P0_CATRO|nr:hypothetical protein M9H77_16406 [Catharanthus roseus]
MDAAMSDELQLMDTIAGGLSRDRLYGAGSETAHLRSESKQTIMRRLRLLFPVFVLPLTSTKAVCRAEPLVVHSYATNDGHRQSCYGCRSIVDIFINDISFEDFSDARVSSSTSPIDVPNTSTIDPPPLSSPLPPLKMLGILRINRRKMSSVTIPTAKQPSVNASTDSSSGRQDVVCISTEGRLALASEIPQHNKLSVNKFVRNKNY